MSDFSDGGIATSIPAASTIDAEEMVSEVEVVLALAFGFFEGFAFVVSEVTGAV